MTFGIRGISSMATRVLLTELISVHAQTSDIRVEIESTGGVDAARRVSAGEAFDFVVLASDVVDHLTLAGHLVVGSNLPVARSGIAVAVRAGSIPIPIDTEAALKAAMLRSSRIGYSTGPSGSAILNLIERWGISDLILPRLVQAKAGVPVARLVAQGLADLGFQQLSELTGVSGIDVLGPLPADIQVMTTFTAARVVTSSLPTQVDVFLAFLASPAVRELKARHGMEHVD